jgi:hypothetical protein
LGNLGGQKVTVAGNSNIDGDAIADPGDINVGNWSQVKGLCVTDAGPGSIILGLPANPPVNFLHCVEGQFTGGGPEADDLANAISDVSTFETTLTTGTTPTQILSTPVTGSGTITDNVSTAPYHNIIQVPAVIIGVAQTLQLKGLGAITHPGETMVLWITGPMKIGANAQILLSGGLTPASVIIYVGGNLSSWGISTRVNGTVLVNSDCTAGISTTLNGAIICNGGVGFGAYANLTWNPAVLVSLP